MNKCGNVDFMMHFMCLKIFFFIIISTVYISLAVPLDVINLQLGKVFQVSKLEVKLAFAAPSKKLEILTFQILLFSSYQTNESVCGCVHF